jgi:hypothetical protein
MLETLSKVTFDGGIRRWMEKPTMLYSVAILYSVYFSSVQFLVFFVKSGCQNHIQVVGCYINHMYYNIYIT